MWFAVIRTRGSAWDDSRLLEQQVEWEEHRQFMNRLEAERFVVLGGPLDGTPDVLLVMQAKSAEEIEDRLALDPWTRSKLLRTTRIAPWDLRLGHLA